MTLIYLLGFRNTSVLTVQEKTVGMIDTNMYLSTKPSVSLIDDRT